jgi:pimeloyl-ACP methyl ester carboxylesterase
MTLLEQTVLLNLNLTMPEVNIHPCFLTPKRVQPHYPLFVFCQEWTELVICCEHKHLLEAAFDVRCLAIPRDDLTSWDVLTENVLDLIQAELENPQRSVYLCGESFGGCLAMKVAIASPHLFKRIIFVNTASAFGRRPGTVGHRN